MTFMRVRTKVAIAVGVVLVAGLGVLATRTTCGGSVCLACGSVTMRVRGRLADASSGAPVAGAWLMTLPNRAWAEEPETIANYRKWNAEEELELSKEQAAGRTPSPRMRASLCASATTDANGGFDVFVRVPWSWREVDGVLQGPRSPPPRDGVEAIRVEPNGGAPFVIEVGSGTWDARRNASDEIWATWDLGALRVPASK